MFPKIFNFDLTRSSKMNYNYNIERRKENLILRLRHGNTCGLLREGESLPFFWYQI
jgi:hypothetical protein